MIRRHLFLPLAIASFANSLCLILMWLPRVASASERPNILLITVDNVGYGDLRSYNPESPIVTPNLDQLASQGARLTSFYTASPTCTVSRACLLTGRLPQRHRLTDQLPGREGNYGVGLNQSEILIAQLVKRSPTPYQTGCFGKWNIGFAPGSRPTERGFDEFIGHASGNIDYYHHTYDNQHDLFQGTEHLHAEGRYSTDLFADAAIDFIQRSQDSNRPWFCYLPFNAPHFPMKKNKRPGQPNIWQAPDWAFDAYDYTPDEADPQKRFFAVMTALDAAIGRVLNTLDQLGAAQNTFVFLMSDNGAFTRDLERRLGRQGQHVGSNDPLRGGGITCWEGGLRVPAFARWPGKIEAGSTIDQPCWSPDLLIACARLSGANLPDGVVYDGRDPLPVLTANAPSPHESFFFTYRSHAALRKGAWKIVRERPDQPWMLFDLATDPSESRDLATQYPERAQALESTFQDWQASFEN